MYDKPKVGIPLKEHPMPPYLQFNIYISLTQILEYESSYNEKRVHAVETFLCMSYPVDYN